MVVIRGYVFNFASVCPENREWNSRLRSPLPQENEEEENGGFIQNVTHARDAL